MKKAILLCGMLLALTATVASAAPGVNLRWTTCWGTNPAASINRAFACTNNTGTNVMCGSFVLPADLNEVSGSEIVIDLASVSPSLPAWWQYKNAGTCRQASLLGFLADDEVACPDWSGGLGTGAVAGYIMGLYGPNTARILCISAVDATALANLTGGQEYGVFKVTFNNLKTVGTGSCAGCTNGVCIIFNSVNMTTSGNLNNTKLSGPANLTDSDYISFNGPAPVVVNNKVGCPQAVPTHKDTWGAVKALYR